MDYDKMEHEGTHVFALKLDDYAVLNIVARSI